MRKTKIGIILIIAIIGFTSSSCKKEIADQNHKLDSRKFQGIPSLAISPEGRFWATWYAGNTPGEDENNYVVVATSGKDGESWTEEIIIDPDGPGPIRAFDPEIWLDPEGKLWVFWAQTVGHDGANSGLWAKTNSRPNKAGSKWSEARRITDGVMMCKPTVLSNGEWILHASTWRETDNSAWAVVSIDKGESLNLRGGCNVPKELRSYDEHMIVEKMDKSLWMLMRTSYGIGESFSNDSGKTWSEATPSSSQQPSARFFIRRLSSGNLLLVKHGPINERIGRSNLTAYLSKDDGQTWLGGLLLDKRKNVSYPDGQQFSDGNIHIIYDYSRTAEREILMATFTEDDIITGDTTSTNVTLRTIISKPSDLYFNTEKIFIQQAEVIINSRLDNSEIRYTTDGSVPKKKSLRYTEPFTVFETTKLKIREFTQDGLEHPVFEANYIKETPIDPVSSSTNINALNFEYFIMDEPIDSTAELQKYEPTETGEIESLAFPYQFDDLPDKFGLKFSGFINVPKEDVYLFSVLSNDGSRLFIADKLVVDNDGKHGDYEKDGEIALKKGMHKIDLSYFQVGGHKGLKVIWKSSEFEKREITKEDLFSGISGN